MTQQTIVRKCLLTINVIEEDGKGVVEMLTHSGKIEDAAAALGNIFAPSLPAKPVALTPPVTPKEEPKPAVVVDDEKALRQKAAKMGIKCAHLPNVKVETLKRLMAEKENGTKPAPTAPTKPAPTAKTETQGGAVNLPKSGGNGGGGSFGGKQMEKGLFKKSECLPVKVRTKDGTKIISVWVTAKQKTKAGVDGYRVCRPDNDADCPNTHIFGAVWFVPATAVVEWCDHPEG